ncbi:sigma factor-like helix-turn-helix DNA-binding protein [Geodermatophilus sp. SYSU D00696]
MTSRRDAAPAALVEDAGPALLRTAVLLTGDRRAGEDLVLGALLRARRRWPAFVRSADPPAALRELLVDVHLGRRRGAAAQVVADVPDPLPDGRAEELRTALQALEPRVRTALVLRHADDLPEEQVARLVGGPVGAVRDDLARGRAALAAAGADGGAALTARLHALAGELTWPDPTVSPDAVAAAYRRQRRARAGVLVAAALVAGVLLAGGPAAVRSLTTASGEATAVSPDDQAASRGAVEELVVEPRLEAAVARLGAPLTLTSPAEWDRRLPGGRADEEAPEDDDGCPPLADRLTAALGVPMDHRAGALPRGPVGCTWSPGPVRLSEGGPYDYAQVVGVGFVADPDGTAIDRLRTALLPGAARRDEPCLAADVPGGGALIGCTGTGGLSTTPLVLAVPDARGAGLWVLSASVQHGAGRSAAEVLAVLVEAVRTVYG